MRILICPLGNPGFLYSALAIGQELRGRGHLVVVLCQPSAMPIAAAAGLIAVNAEEYGSARSFSIGSWHWIDEGATQYAIVRAAARDLGADAVLTSILCHGTLIAAERLGLPAAVLGLTAWLWPYREGGSGAYRDYLLKDTRRTYDQVRDQAGLPPRRDRHAERPLLGAAFLHRGHPEFEHPGARLPDEVAYVGPCAWEPAADPAETEPIIERLREVGKPVVYVHLGRTFGGRTLWPRLNAAFTGGPFQAVVERGRSGQPEPAPGADVLVVRKPWMDPLVQQAEVVLCNATSTPVLAALRHGLPLVVVPNGSEQPVVAEACRRAGAALRIAPQTGDGPADTDDPMAPALASARHDPALARNARRLGTLLRTSGGVAHAADIVTTLTSATGPDAVTAVTNGTVTPRTPSRTSRTAP
jgi:UDP:flavonoid glycosyltransferase YjiC (YdhE family)